MKDVIGVCSRCGKQSKTFFCKYCKMWSIVTPRTLEMLKKRKQILKMDDREKAEKTFAAFLKDKMDDKDDAKIILLETMKEYDQNYLDSICAKEKYTEKEALDFCSYILAHTPTNGASMRKLFDKLSERVMG